MRNTCVRLLLFGCLIALGFPERAVAAALAPLLVSPADGASAADLSQPIQWTTVPNAEAYYLYLGTTRGAKDLADSGAIATTSYLASRLPIDQTVFARVWAKVAGVWRYTDASFKGAPLTTSLIYPSANAVNADIGLPIRWTPVPNAQAY